MKKVSQIPTPVGVFLIIFGFFLFPTAFYHQFGEPFIPSLSKFFQIPAMVIILTILGVIFFKIDIKLFIVLITSFLTGFLLSSTIGKEMLPLWTNLPKDFNWFWHFTGMGFCFSLIFSGIFIVWKNQIMLSS